MTRLARANVPEQRLLHVDAIHGLALFGVLLVNLLTQDQLALTEQQIEAMPTAAVDRTLVFLFVLYGFGLGALPIAGALFCLVLAVAMFAPQISISRWWLARFRYGPME
jgi:uncharacterized protein